MTEDKPLKSALDLAMERLRKRDEETGVQQRTLTDGEKATIAATRSYYQAKIAEAEVLHQSRRMEARDPLELDAMDAEFRQERQRLIEERDAKIEKIRRGE
jgi:hypothetical protein